MEMIEFRVTFGQKYRREPHPTLGDLVHPDGWLTILAPDELTARVTAIGWLGREWSGLYRANDPEGDWDLYTLGELHRIEAPVAGSSHQVPAT